MADLIEKSGSQAVYWDSVAREKRFSHPLRSDWLAEYLTPDSRILDYGCGYGRTLAQLVDSGYQNVLGVDFSEGMLARCRNEVSGADLIRNDGKTFPLQRGSCAAVLLFAVLTCIPSSEEQRAHLREAERVLRSGGLLYISDLLVNTDERNRARYEQYSEAYQCYGVFELPEGVVVRHHTEDWIEDITASFQKLKYEPFTVTTMNGHASAAFQYLGRKAG